jgi:hypothetical protein
MERSCWICTSAYARSLPTPFLTIYPDTILLVAITCMPGVGCDMDGVEDCNPVGHQNQCPNDATYHVEW